MHTSLENNRTTETTSLLYNRQSSLQNRRHYTESPLTIPLPSPYREGEQQIATHPTTTPTNSSRFKWFNKRSGSYDEDRLGLVRENTGIRVWSESYSSIDWIHDRIKEGVRKRKLQEVSGLRGRLLKTNDALQAWLLVILVGTVVAAIAWFIDVVQEWMSDLKQGYCTTNWRLNSNFCCWENNETCHAWKTWPEVFGVEDEELSYYVAMLMYTVFGLLFSLIAALMVKFTAEKVKTHHTAYKPVPFSKTPSITSIPCDTAYLSSCEPDKKDEVIQSSKNEAKVAYYSAGSGIPEVKVILGGFVIKGFLGIKTLIVKSIGMIFSTSAGLTVGKEGPFVHLACSAGNIACRLFPKYNKNESKRREILSASAAAGVAVAFGAPIGGVLFSLEEVSYYFPMKTMIRSYCCAAVAAIVLKITDPFGTGKIVLYQVSYDKDYHLFELIPMIICGAFAGFFGAFTTFFNIKFQHLRRSTFIGRYPIIEVLCIMLVTAIISFWNPFSRMSLNEFAAQLFSECSSTNDNGGLCAYTTGEIPRLLYLLITALIIKMALTIVTFGCSVPGGIFLPSLIIGAITGRIIGLIMQYVTLSYPSLFPACAYDLETRGECIIPGVYALVGAAAGLAGVTKTTISLVVIIYELTYSLTYSLPIMIAVMVAKWIADAMFVEGIYDLLIDLKQYPYLEARREYIHTMTITNVTEYLSTISVDLPITVGELKHKLSVISTMGYGEDGGFPILSDGNILEGYIATSEVSHGLEQLENALESSMTETEINQVPCYFTTFNQGLSFDNPSTNIIDNQDLKTPIRTLLENNIDTSSINNLEEVASKQMTLNNFSQYIDHAPLTINQNASMTLLMDMFTKLGARYVCVTHSNGRYLGIIHKRRLLAYLKGLDEGDE
ncbi:chloride channel [Cokeromyces recurvatus]|uniref:chloride channel n=1 Tax=Cokeromyces recurvatus TaxID=90255 RepID=UPI00221E56CD|nr:chloride channel [Cokeromyces recurvatus]KAI7904064.1 chloride channel [Cokeromyces recurvatus]